MDKVILHCDMNGFFASVELLDYPELKDGPMAVCGNPEDRRGIILAKNQLAKEKGIVTAETLFSALKKCPDLKVVPPHHEKYSHYSKLINEIYYRYTDLVEPFSIDESWLDVTKSRKLFGEGKEIADSIRETVKETLGLTLSVGVSFNKIFAKLGSEYKKPDATTVITRENFREILWPLPAKDMLYVGRVMSLELQKLGIHTIGDLALADKGLLESTFGKTGLMVHLYAKGFADDTVSPMTEKRRIKSVGNGITFRRNLKTDEDITAAIMGLSDNVAARLRQYGLKAKGVKVDIKNKDFLTISRQVQLGSSSDSSFEIWEAAKALALPVSKTHGPVRLITVTAINLAEGETDMQLSFFNGESKDKETYERLDKTFDHIRSKYGPSAITFASLVNNEIGIDLEEMKEED